MVKNLLAMWETWDQSPGREDILEDEVVTHSSILTWEIPWTGAQRAKVHGITISGTGLRD